MRKTVTGARTVALIASLLAFAAPAVGAINCLGGGSALVASASPADSTGLPWG